MNGAFAFDIPDNLRNRILGWDRYQHVHMIPYQMAFVNLALSVACQLLENITHMFSQIAVQNLFAIFWNPNQVVLAIPCCVT
jgi:hypothetical protein